MKRAAAVRMAIDAGADAGDEIVTQFLEYAADRGLSLYSAQEEAIIEVALDRHVIVNTPTGSGKSMVATAAHFAALAQGRQSWYTAPIKALVSEKFFALCREFGVWFHVDAAIGGVCGLSDQHRWRVAGLELADSVCLNPQKLLGISKPSSVLLVRRSESLADTFSTALPYMEETASPQGGDLGLQGTRGAEVLKLWLGLQHLGLEGIDAVISAALERRQCLLQLLEPLPLTLLPGDLHLLSFRHASLAGEAAMGWRDRVHQALLEHNLWLSKPNINGQPLLKAVLGNPFTGERELQQIAAVLQAS